MLARCSCSSICSEHVGQGSSWNTMDEQSPATSFCWVQSISVNVFLPHVSKGSLAANIKRESGDTSNDQPFVVESRTIHRWYPDAFGFAFSFFFQGGNGQMLDSLKLETEELKIWKHQDSKRWFSKEESYGSIIQSKKTAFLIWTYWSCCTSP